MRKCVFFDRDGIVNESPGPGYVERWEDFRLLPGFVRALAVVRRAGWDAVVVTNQRGVSRGLMSAEAVAAIHANLRRVLHEEHGLDLLDIRCCPHGEGECACRKPKPGMLMDAARLHGIDLAASWMVGDHPRDVEAGRRAGCRTVLVGADDGTSGANEVVPDLAALEALLLRVLA